MVGSTQIDDVLMAPEETSREPHEAGYIAAVITPLANRSVLNKADLAVSTDEPAMLFGIDEGSLLSAAEPRATWLGETGIASRDTLGLFDLRKVEVVID